MNGPKIQFSVAEIELMNNANIILTKNEVQRKIRGLLETAQQQMVSCRKEDDGLFLLPPKISKGENYLGLPYLVLDYPRHFDGANITLLRSMFWWGHFFSSTLFLSGTTKNRYAALIKNGYSDLAAADYYIGINTDPWQHHFEKDNYCRIATLSREEFIACCEKFDHIKIAAKWPLLQEHSTANELIESWRFLLGLLQLIAS